MHNIVLILAYEGTNYLGWQKTICGPSIEHALETILCKILQQPIVLQAASRTDAGVHARAQVVNFFYEGSPLDENRLKMSINALLPPDITVTQVILGNHAFHPTLDCIAKEYHYYICNSEHQLPFHRNFSWHYYYPLNQELMQEAASKLIGEHDFSAFCNSKKNETYAHTVRSVSSLEIHLLPEKRFCFKIIGKNFLYKMVRNLIGTLAYVGRGKITVENVSNILKSGNRTLAGITAPANGLVLQKVYYPKGALND